MNKWTGWFHRDNYCEYNHPIRWSDLTRRNAVVKILQVGGQGRISKVTFEVRPEWDEDVSYEDTWSRADWTEWTAGEKALKQERGCCIRGKKKRAVGLEMCEKWEKCLKCLLKIQVEMLNDYWIGESEVWERNWDGWHNVVILDTEMVYKATGLYEITCREYVKGEKEKRIYR